MNLVERAFGELFPGETLEYDTSVKYSGKFSDYNANMRLYAGTLELRLSKKWRGVNREIIIGLVQSLLLKILKRKAESMNIDLYNNFVKNLHLAIPKDNIEPALEESFNRVNDNYFFGQIEIPNLMWGTDSVRKLGSYDYKTDTIKISKVFEDEQELLDYVMYHELLHKKHGFQSKGNRNYFHDSKFRRSEREFKDADLMEKKIAIMLRNKPKKQKSRISRFFPW